MVDSEVLVWFAVCAMYRQGVNWCYSGERANRRREDNYDRDRLGHNQFSGVPHRA